MKILVSTEQTQGRRKNDFSWTKVGEFVRFGGECSRSKVDDSCGCKRSMVGMITSKATTTVIVYDSPLTQAEYIKMYNKSAQDSGFGSDWTDDALLILRIAEQFPVDSVLERRGNGFKKRDY